MPRAGYVGDELGSRVIAARLVHDLMNLCFLIERHYAPYSKWFGTAFQQLTCAEALTPVFHAALSALTWQEREKALTAAYEHVAEMQNNLNVIDPLPTKVSQFHNRPFMVIHTERFVNALTAQLQDPEVKRIAAFTHIGAIEQFSTSTDVLAHREITRRMRTLYE